MTNTQDLNVVEDFISLFDLTLNDDAKIELRRVLSTPLTSLEAISSRQMILKEILHSELSSIYTYHKTDYAEVSYFLNIVDAQNFKNVDYLTYLFQKRTNNRLIGHYIQFAYLFFGLDKLFNEHLHISKFPKSYQEDLRFIVHYIRSFQLKKFKKQINKGKLNYSAIQYLNETVLSKRKNGDTAKFYSILNSLEAYISIAAATKKLGFTFPTLGKESFCIQQMFHPLLKNPISNDFQTDSCVILLTGANMSGKSTFLKTIGLIVYFAHLGLAVPAKEAVLPYYDFISIYINHSDDLKNGLSHFKQEIMNMKTVLENAKQGQRCFAVFDELYKGTNYQDALNLSTKTIQGLSQFDACKFLISTHIYELKNQIENEDGVLAYHLHCEIEDDNPKFTYQLKEGWTNLRIGELLFQKEGLEDLLKS